MGIDGGRVNTFVNYRVRLGVNLSHKLPDFKVMIRSILHSNDLTRTKRLKCRNMQPTELLVTLFIVSQQGKNFSTFSSHIFFI